MLVLCFQKWHDPYYNLELLIQIVTTFIKKNPQGLTWFGCLSHFLQLDKKILIILQVCVHSGTTKDPLLGRHNG